MEPFDVLKGKTLSRKDSPGEVKLEANVSLSREEIFPFAVPRFRLPLLPSSRNGLVKVA